MQRVADNEPHQVDYPNCLLCKPFIRILRRSIDESRISFRNLSHWYVYQCLFLTLVSLLVTFILVIAHSSRVIHLVCCIIR